jgi:hypothetical protein
MGSHFSKYFLLGSIRTHALEFSNGGSCPDATPDRVVSCPQGRAGLWISIAKGLGADSNSGSFDNNLAAVHGLHIAPICQDRTAVRLPLSNTAPQLSALSASSQLIVIKLL